MKAWALTRLVGFVLLVIGCASLESDIYQGDGYDPEVSEGVRRLARSQFSFLQEDAGITSAEEQNSIELVANLRVMVKGAQGDRGSSGEHGPPGSKGSLGLQGARGYQGVAGAQGAPGLRANDKGARGPKGPQGEHGESGPQGVAGVRGSPGMPGRVGPAGKQGDRSPHQGPPGESGLPGIQGLKGKYGALGPAGQKGNPGQSGAPGDKGARGSMGLRGTRGPAGLTGQPGITGEVGVQGPEGPAGSSGALGPEGKVGPHGIQGSAGAVGAAGTVGKVGKVGRRGNLGADGLEGSQGMEGAAGVPGILGTIGQQGNIGLPGQQGKLGERGPDGEVGRTGMSGAAGAAGEQGHPGVTGVRGATGPAGFTFLYHATGPFGFEVGGHGPGQFFSGQHGLALKHSSAPTQIKFIQKKGKTGRAALPGFIGGYFGNLGIGTQVPYARLHVKDPCVATDHVTCTQRTGQIVLDSPFRNVLLAQVQHSYFDLIGSYPLWTNAAPTIHIGAADKTAYPKTQHPATLYFGGISCAKVHVKSRVKVDLHTGKLYAQQFTTLKSLVRIQNVLSQADSFLEVKESATDISEVILALHAKTNSHDVLLKKMKQQALELSHAMDSHTF